MSKMHYHLHLPFSLYHVTAAIDTQMLIAQSIICLTWHLVIRSKVKKNSKTELQSPNTFVEKCQAQLNNITLGFYKKKST